MRERLGKSERRNHLSRVLLIRHAEAQSQEEFTAASLACEAGVSRVWFYTLVGEEFKNLRASLPGRVTSGETLVAKLRKDIVGLRTQLKDLKAKYEASIKEKLAEAIRHIELLDKENRMLRETVAALEKRLGDNKLVIFSEVRNNPIGPLNDES
jgi:hypothetical protein